MLILSLWGQHFKTLWSRKIIGLFKEDGRGQPVGVLERHTKELYLLNPYYLQLPPVNYYKSILCVLFIGI